MRMRNFWVKREEETAGEATASAGVVTENTPALSDPANSSTEEDVNWTGLADEFQAEDGGETVEGDLAVVEPKEPVVPAATVPADAPAAEPPVVPAPAAPAAPVVPAPSAPAAPAASQQDYQAWKTTRLTQLEQTYALNEADATAMITEPETVLPRLAAQMHMEVLESSMRAMQAMMPVMLQQMTQHTETEGKAKGLFTSVNPDLANPQYEPAIMQLGQVYRNVNPTASPEEAARAIGALVRSALNMTAPVAGGTPPAAPALPVAPAPFSPARGSGGGNAPVASSNPFEAMAAEMLQDE